MHCSSNFGTFAYDTSNIINLLSCYRMEILEKYHIGLSSLITDFPIKKVLIYYHTYGKHFVSPSVLEELHMIQVSLQACEPVQANREYDLLQHFLHILLDKYNNNYNYLSYIGASLLEGAMIDANLDFAEHQNRRILHLISILCDIIHFECETLLKREERFTGFVTSFNNLKSRIFKSLKSIQTYKDFTTYLLPSVLLDELLLRWKQEITRDEEFSSELGNLTLDFSYSILQKLSKHELSIINMTILPVWTIHDEYMFIRILQSFEMLFSIVVKGFLTCQDNIRTASFAHAQAVMETLTAIYQGSSTLFRVLTTMSKESFSAFRVYTDGASAIQSEQYKMIETLSSPLSQTRLHSPAFSSVPRIKAMYEQKQIVNLEDLLQYYLQHPAYLSDETFQGFMQSMKAFDQASVSWKHMHYNIAVKMLGSNSGTGGTPGTPYLKEFKDTYFFIKEIYQ